jgi:UDP-N-acetyl-D-glucosamine dehydrogenase
MREYHFDLESTPLNSGTLGAQDLVLLATDHDAFDYELVRDNAPLIVDTRGRYSMSPAAHIVPA